MKAVKLDYTFAAGVPGQPGVEASPLPFSPRQQPSSLITMKKDFRYYENKIREIQDAKYRVIALEMLVKGDPREKIVDAIIEANQQDLLEALTIDATPKNN